MSAQSQIKEEARKNQQNECRKSPELKITPLFIQYIPIENSPGGGTVARDVTASLWPSSKNMHCPALFHTLK